MNPPTGDYAREQKAARLAAAEQEFGSWLEAQFNGSPHRAAATADLLAGLEQAAIAEQERRAATAEWRRNRREGS